MEVAAAMDEVAEELKRPDMKMPEVALEVAGDVVMAIEEGSAVTEAARQRKRSRVYRAVGFDTMKAIVVW